MWKVSWTVGQLGTSILRHVGRLLSSFDDLQSTIISSSPSTIIILQHLTYPRKVDSLYLSTYVTIVSARKPISRGSYFRIVTSTFCHFGCLLSSLPDLQSIILSSSPLIFPNIISIPNLSRQEPTMVSVHVGDYCLFQ